MSECKRYTSDAITDKYGNYRTYSTVKMAAMLRQAAGNFKANERRK